MWRNIALATMVTGLFLTGGAWTPVSPGTNATANDNNVLATFDREDEDPEGIAVDRRGNVWVSLASSATIARISRQGEVERVAVLDPALFPQAQGALGLAVDAPGNVYAALVSFNPATHGVWRLTPTRRGIHATDVLKERLPGSEKITFPNSLAFDRRGNLYVTDSVAGAIWKFPADGTAPVGPWLQHGLLEGLASTLEEGDPTPGNPIGANGIVFRQGELFVANTDKGLIVRVGVELDGSPGTVEALPPHPFLFALDGIAMDVRGDLWVLSAGFSLLLRVSPDRDQVEVRATAAGGLDEPTSLAFGTGRGNRKSVFIANRDVLPGVVFDGEDFVPGGIGQSVVKVDVGVPGWPLP